MKIRIGAALLLALLTLPVLAGCGLWMMDEGLDAVEDMAENRVEAAYALNDLSVPASATNPPAEALTRQDAESIALEHAGLTADQVRFLHTEYEIDDGVAEYQVEFRYDRWEYEYDIDANTGIIRSYSRDD